MDLKINPLKRFDIRLTDIWIESQNQLIELRDKIVDLKSCLNTSEQINKHLIKCNEILVAIIEKCKIDEHKDKGLNILIKTIKKEEECIAAEKENLKKVKNQIKSDFNEQKVFDVIGRWNLNKSLKNSTEDKSVQTCEGSFVFITENLVDIDSGVKIETKNESKDLVTIELNQIENQFDNESDISAKSDVIDIHSEDSSDFDPQEVEELSEKKRTAKRREGRRRTQRINSLVMPFKVDNHYVCNESDCEFSSGVKRIFYRHRIQKHRHLNPKETKTKVLVDKKHIRINEMINPFKVDDQFICTTGECHFKSKIKIVFYRHLREHNPIKKRSPPEVRSNNSERPYVCDWPACGMAFKKAQHLRGHRKRHMGERDYVCDWPGCGAEMYTSHNYYTHRLTHTDERPYKCDWPACLYSCKQKWALVAHRRVHTGEKPYLCPFPECGYRCSQPCTMLSHKRKHTGEKPYECNVPDCHKRFSSLAGIWTHKKVHQRQEMEEFGRRTKPKRDDNNLKQIDSNSDEEVKNCSPVKRSPRLNKQNPNDVSDLIGKSLTNTKDQ